MLALALIKYMCFEKSTNGVSCATKAGYAMDDMNEES